MSYEPLQQQTVAIGAEARVVDAGLQAHMRSVYNTMCWGLTLTGATSALVANVEALRNIVFSSSLVFYAFAFAPLLFLWFGLTPQKLMRMEIGKARNMFVGFAVLMGVSMASLFVVYSGESIARVFFITSATFATMSLWGYTTKRDLSGMGHFLMMGLMGIFFAMIVNIFLGSEMVHFVVSALGIVIFTGLTAWETQVIKETYAVGHGRDTNQKMAITGALSLYLSFINLFMFLMHFMGQRD